MKIGKQDANEENEKFFRFGVAQEYIFWNIKILLNVCNNFFSQYIWILTFLKVF